MAANFNRNRMMIYILGLFLYSTNCIGQNQNFSDQFSLRDFTTLSTGTESPLNNKLLIICYNKHFNKEKFDHDFLKNNRLDQINYEENMSVEIFLGQVKEKIVNLKVDKIEENSSQINVYYSFQVSRSSEISNKNSPYVIVETPKSRKVVVFYENGVPFKVPGNNS